MRTVAGLLVVLALFAGCSRSNDPELEALRERVKELEAQAAATTTTTTRAAPTTTRATTTTRSLSRDTGPITDVERKVLENYCSEEANLADGNNPGTSRAEVLFGLHCSGMVLDACNYDSLYGVCTGRCGYDLILSWIRSHYWEDNPELPMRLSESCG